MSTDNWHELSAREIVKMQKDNPDSIVSGKFYSKGRGEVSRRSFAVKYLKLTEKETYVTSKFSEILEDFEASEAGAKKKLEALTRLLQRVGAKPGASRVQALDSAKTEFKTLLFFRMFNSKGEPVELMAGHIDGQNRVNNYSVHRKDGTTRTEKNTYVDVVRDSPKEVKKRLQDLVDKMPNVEAKFRERLNSHGWNKK